MQDTDVSSLDDSYYNTYTSKSPKQPGVHDYHNVGVHERINIQIGASLALNESSNSSKKRLLEENYNRCYLLLQAGDTQCASSLDVLKLLRSFQDESQLQLKPVTSSVTSSQKTDQRL